MISVQAQNILVEKVLYRDPGTISLYSVNRNTGELYFGTKNKSNLLIADLRSNKILLDSTISNDEYIGFTKFDPVFSLGQKTGGNFYLINRINGFIDTLPYSSNFSGLPPLEYDLDSDLFYGVINNKVISSRITREGVLNVDTIGFYKGETISSTHTFDDEFYYSVIDENNNHYLAKNGVNGIQKLRYPINYGADNNDIVVLNKDSLIVSRRLRPGENQIALIYASNIVSQLDTIELLKIVEVETTQIDSVVNENYFAYQDYSAKKNRDIGKGRWSTLIEQTTSAVKAMLTLNDALSANPRSFSYKKDSVYFILGPKQELKSAAEEDSIYFQKRGIVTKTFDIIHDTLVKPSDIVLRLKCIDRQTGLMPNYHAEFYDHETNTLMKSTDVFENEVVYFSYLPEYTLGLTITADDYLPHSIKVDPNSDYTSGNQIDKLVLLDKFIPNALGADDNKIPRLPSTDGALREWGNTNPTDSAANDDPLVNATASNSEEDNLVNSPSLAGTAGIAQNKSISRPVELKNIFFAFDSEQLSDASKRELSLVLSSKKDAKTITVYGHTDSIGSDDYNRGLSERRAKAVGNYLRSLGYSGELEMIGMGESKPVASNKTEKGRDRNRRCEITLAY